MARSRRIPAPCARCGSTASTASVIISPQKVDFVVAAAADLPALRQHARKRRWYNLRLLSCGTSTFKYDLLSEDAEGNQLTYPEGPHRPLR